MPRTNAGRDLTRERSVATRVAYERDRREWSLETMARRLTEAGCPIPASAIYKIEKGEPPRSITVIEFLTFAEVFGLSPEELLEPVEVAQSRVLQRLVRARKAKSLTLRKEAKRLCELEQLIKAELESLGQSVPDADGDIRVVDEPNGSHVIIDMKVVRS